MVLALAREGLARVRRAPREVPPEPEPLDQSEFLGMGRSLTFPFPQWRDHDEHRTVFFDEGWGRSLVFVHGVGGNATHFEFVARALAKHHRVVGLDLVGQGWSAKPRDARYTVDLLSDHLLDFLDRRGIERATLVGHSLGGAVCLDAALRRPGLVDGLVLMCAAGVAPVPRWMRASAPVFLHPPVLMPTLFLGAHFIVRNVFHDRPEDNPNVRWFRESSMRDAPGYPNFRDFARVAAPLCRDAARRDYSDRFGEIQAPVLALWGDRDKLTALPSVLERLGGIRRLRTVVLKDCGHMPMIERDEETVHHLERFLLRPP